MLTDLVVVEQVTTDFIFHCEDDWVFNGIPGFVADSVAILQYEPTVFNVLAPPKLPHFDIGPLHHLDSANT